MKLENKQEHRAPASSETQRNTNKIEGEFTTYRN